MLTSRLFSQRVMASIALLVAMLLWASSYIALKYAVGVFHPLVMVTGRMLVAVLVLAVFSKWIYRSLIRLSRRDLALLVILGLLEPSLYLLLEGYAIKLTTASQAGMIVASQPIFVMVLAWFILKERFRRRTAVGFALALWGVVWLCTDGVATETAPNPMLGNILECMAMFCAAMYVITAKNLSPACSPLLITAAQAVVGLFFFLPMLALPDVDLPQTFPLLPTLSVAYLGIMVSLVSFVLYNYAVTRLPAVQTGAFLNLVPILTLIMGMVVMGDTLTPGQWIASALVMSGVILSQSAPPIKQKLFVPEEEKITRGLPVTVTVLEDLPDRACADNCFAEAPAAVQQTIPPGR